MCAYYGVPTFWVAFRMAREVAFRCLCEQSRGANFTLTPANLCTESRISYNWPKSYLHYFLVHNYTISLLLSQLLKNFAKKRSLFLCFHLSVPILRGAGGFEKLRRIQRPLHNDIFLPLQALPQGRFEHNMRGGGACTTAVSSKMHLLEESRNQIDSRAMSSHLH